MRLRARAVAFGIGSALALAWGVAAAARLTWICDDAFISIRYAQNLARGLGLVYNAGERVEGFTNFLFTLGLALGMKLGLDPERLATGAGIFFHAALLSLLAFRAWRARGRSAPVLPVAALLAAAHPDLAVWATSGLETSCYTFLVFAGFVAAAEERPGPRRSAAAGALLALASLTRPEGVLFVVCAGAWILWAGTPRRRATAAFGGAFALLYLPPTLWRVGYYGHFVANTYWAKSANLAWWRQGLTYVGLYFARYPHLVAAVPIAMVVSLRRGAGGERPGLSPAVVLATASATVYTAYVARVGGDFMFARFLIPVTPLLLVLLEEAIALALPSLRAQTVATAVVAASLALSRSPATSDFSRTSGIADERDYYTRLKKDWNELPEKGAALAPLLRGLPIGVGFIGSNARLIYYADPKVAVECETGLTDAVIARQPVASRGRVGHEKCADIEYLVEDRKLLVCFDLAAVRVMRLADSIPVVPIALGPVPGLLLRWDAPLLSELGRRGVKIPDFPAEIDSYVARMGGMSDAKVRADYRRMKLFYFDQVADPAREAPFRRRLATAFPGRSGPAPSRAAPPAPR